MEAFFLQIDVVITETMDCGLLGEGIACSLYDVQTRILSPSPVIIPRCVRVLLDKLCFFNVPKRLDLI